ncbi:hypothetical protein BFJ71_g6601 [Fusarium oxysporum]|nr:hypothetical protein BFJ71_g6601 [Fusarium oxysporum]
MVLGTVTTCLPFVDRAEQPKSKNSACSIRLVQPSVLDNLSLYDAYYARLNGLNWQHLPATVANPGNLAQ